MAEHANQQESDLPTTISAPARRALIGAGYTRLSQVAETSEAKLKQLHGMGPKALGQLREAMVVKGLRFADAKE